MPSDSGKGGPQWVLSGLPQPPSSSPEDAHQVLCSDGPEVLGAPGSFVFVDNYRLYCDCWKIRNSEHPKISDTNESLGMRWGSGYWAPVPALGALGGGGWCGEGHTLSGTETRARSVRALALLESAESRGASVSHFQPARTVVFILLNIGEPVGPPRKALGLQGRGPCSP